MATGISAKLFNIFRKNLDQIKNSSFSWAETLDVDIISFDTFIVNDNWMRQIDKHIWKILN